jgi:hypothetical protein
MNSVSSSRKFYKTSNDNEKFQRSNNGSSEQVNQEELNSREKIKDTISTILDVPNTRSWEVIDQIPNEGLYMVHYTNTADLTQYGELRGIIVDINSKEIVCRSYAHSPIAVYSKLELNNNLLSIYDENGMIHEFNEKTMRIKRGYEGVMIRIFKHNNNIYFSTHRRINAINSKWGNSLTFKDMYKQLINIDPEEMFNPDEASSPVVQLFVLVHPDVQQVSKINLSKGGFPIYFGGKLVRDVPDENKYSKYFNLSQFSEDIEERITIPEANEFLTYGHYPEVKLSSDERLNPGEFVVIQDVQEGEVRDMVVIHSLAYNWRSFVRNNNSNLHLQFYKLFIFMGKNAVNDKFPMINYFPESYIEKILDNGPLIMWPVNNKNKIESNALYRIWASLLLAVPLDKQRVVFNLLKEYHEDKRELKNYLIKLLDYEDINSKDISEDTKQLIIDVKNTNHPLNEDYRKNLIKEINFRVDRMKGQSLYRMIKDMKCVTKESGV